MGKPTFPERYMPWRLNLPIYDEAKGCYVTRKPVHEPKKPDLAPTPGHGQELTPLDKGYDAYMKAKKKREAELEKKAAAKKDLRRQTHGPAKVVQRQKQKQKQKQKQGQGQGQTTRKKDQKVCPWERTSRVRKPRKMLSLRGERV